ncbi:MAG TPA: DJ-1/PfpI family protein [Candidatus Latescibacteria bacterium]|nr:DJ-1/PfpI family protein [Candidatus Latescibacterota bacterium]
MAKLAGKKVVMIIAEKNFRDEELLRPKEILEGEGAEVKVASTSPKTATGMLGAKVEPDMLVNRLEVKDYDAVIFVGGSGSSQYWNDPAAHRIAREAVEGNKLLCAICIAPVTLANAGLLAGKRATVFSSETGKLRSKGVLYTGRSVETDGNIITAEGPQAAEEFGRAIAEALCR